MQIPEPDAQKLLKILEADLASKRQQREARANARMGFRVGSILMILILLIGALWLLQSMASQIPRPEPAPSVEKISSLSTKPGIQPA